mmetsp:Transcript_35641/g.65317  ORF Transcript_35641/g.65317 Transcript_35641/m.65317 type:complete len:142 (+) Transcript_35641:103-528(+)
MDADFVSRMLEAQQAAQTGSPTDCPDMKPYMSRAPGANPQRVQQAQAEYEELHEEMLRKGFPTVCCMFCCCPCTCGLSLCCGPVCCLTPTANEVVEWAETYPLEAQEVKKAVDSGQIPMPLPIPEPTPDAVRRRKKELGML